MLQFRIAREKSMDRVPQAASKRTPFGAAPSENFQHGLHPMCLKRCMAGSKERPLRASKSW